MASSRSSSPSSEDSNDNTEIESNKCTNIFRNDGSFLEMFKKMQNASQPTNNVATVSSNTVRIKKDIVEEQPTVSKPMPLVGRRRGSKALPVGKVKKVKMEDESKKSTTTDAWAKYLEEVKKYKETYCDSETKNRSLVK
ncbi:hypothetical protein PGB90_004241 [Kerria lacca]